MRVARALARAGADVVLGAHAHVAQPAEVLLLNGFIGNGAAERSALAGVPAASRLDGAPGPPRKALVLYCLGASCT
jgi:poly-gamma-glutamate capsule biosynthesis protein CapA/YwtB (metallophosphatase superfamily)